VAIEANLEGCKVIKKKVAAIQGLAAIMLRGFPGAATECLGGGSGGFPLGYL